jgi:hypothetical protein
MSSGNTNSHDQVVLDDQWAVLRGMVRKGQIPLERVRYVIHECVTHPRHRDERLKEVYSFVARNGDSSVKVVLYEPQWQIESEDCMEVLRAHGAIFLGERAIALLYLHLLWATDAEAFGVVHPALRHHLQAFSFSEENEQNRGDVPMYDSARQGQNCNRMSTLGGGWKTSHTLVAVYPI